MAQEMLLDVVWQPTREGSLGQMHVSIKSL